MLDRSTAFMQEAERDEYVITTLNTQLYFIIFIIIISTMYYILRVVGL